MNDQRCAQRLRAPSDVVQAVNKRARRQARASIAAGRVARAWTSARHVAHRALRLARRSGALHGNQPLRISYDSLLCTRSRAPRRAEQCNAPPTLRQSQRAALARVSKLNSGHTGD